MHMSRIAEAQRRHGRHVAQDAEIAWQQACTAAEGLLSRSRPEHSESPDQETLLLTPLVHTTSGSVADASVSPLPSLVNPDPDAFQTELSTLVQRVFDVPPFGAGARCVMFCSVESKGADALTAAIADVLASAATCARIARVPIAHGLAAPAELANAGIRVLSMNPAEVYHRISDLKTRFDYVLLNAQVTASNPEVLPVARAADGVVIVVNEKTTRRRVAKQVVELLSAARATLLGSVLTDRSYPIPQRIYQQF
jgi:hypothetical protein